MYHHLTSWTKTLKGDFTSVVNALMGNGGPHDRCKFFCHQRLLQFYGITASMWIEILRSA